MHLRKFARIYKIIISAKPVVSFNIALGIAKFRFNVYSYAYGIVCLGGLAFVDNQVLLWFVEFQFLLNHFNKPVGFLDETDSASIQIKEMLAIPFNISVFCKYVLSEYCFLSV